MTRDKKLTTPRDEPRTHEWPEAWLRLQRNLSLNTGVALATYTLDRKLIGRVENDNSICRIMQSSPEHRLLCQADCTNAYNRVAKEGRRVEYKCHAGLQCFALPLKASDRDLVVLGGRAFSTTGDYRDFLVNYGDLPEVKSGEALKGAKFLSRSELRLAAELVSSAAMPAGSELTHATPVESPARPLISDNRSRVLARFMDFLRTVAATLDSQEVYSSVLAKFGEILRAERVSLMLFNEQSNELALEAAVGMDTAMSGPIRMKMGEGIAGKVLATGSALVVSDVDTDERIRGPRRPQYKTKSFISMPITLGTRKFGVINVTERMDGASYGSEDLSLLEMLSSHLALLIDRAEWHKRAEQFQRMSLTDPLTGLPNRRYLEERLFEEVERSKRHGTSLSFMIIDVDRFKSYNDIFGHTNADLVLMKTAQILRRSVRAIDMSTRFAGDEFCVVLPETEIDSAVRIAERLRKSVGQTEYRTENGQPMGRVTISIGVSSFSPARQSPLAIIETADRALYQAKTRGRNCVAVYEDAMAVG